MISIADAPIVSHEMVVIIRPSFKKICEQDPCQATLLNHLLYWIAQKAKGQETDKISSGEVYWYGSYQDICSTGLDDSWSMWKVRKELKALGESGLILDDLGVEQATPAAIRQFYELVEERRGKRGLYTVITSNLSIDDQGERWRPEGVAPGSFHEGMCVTDRLRESWGELEIQGMSLRAIHRNVQ